MERGDDENASECVATGVQGGFTERHRRGEAVLGFFVMVFEEEGGGPPAAVRDSAAGGGVPTADR